MPAPAENQDRMGDLHRMPVGEELKIGTTPVVMPGTGVLFILMGSIFTWLEDQLGLYLAILFSVVGILFLFFRRSVLLDCRKRLLTVRSSVFFIRWQKQYSVADHTMVKITYFTITTHEGEEVGRYHVRLVHLSSVKDDDEGALILSTESHPRARGVAEQVAKFMELGIADFSSGKALVRDAQAVNESLRDRLVRYGRVPVMPSRPARCRIRERVVADWVEFRLPKLDHGLVRDSRFLPLVIMVLVLSISCVQIILARPPGSMTNGEYLLLVGFISILAVPLAAYALFALSFQERVRVGKQGLVLLTSSIYRRRRRAIPSEMLEELFVGIATDSRVNVGREAVVARSDEVSLEFGARLNDDERRWLRDVIFYLVTAPERAS